MPLSWAALNGQEAVVRLLLENAVDVASKDAKYGRTPLPWAAENGHEGLVMLLLEKAVDVL
jgi:ankyrin repeat protein